MSRGTIRCSNWTQKSLQQESQWMVRLDHYCQGYTATLDGSLVVWSCLEDKFSVALVFVVPCRDGGDISHRSQQEGEYESYQNRIRRILETPFFSPLWFSFSSSSVIAPSWALQELQRFPFPHSFTTCNPNCFTLIMPLPTSESHHAFGPRITFV